MGTPGREPLTLQRVRALITDPAPDREAGSVVCASGYRSSAATSLLEHRGFRDLYNVTGGTTAWVNAGFAGEK